MGTIGSRMNDLRTENTKSSDEKVPPHIAKRISETITLKRSFFGGK